MQKTAEIRHAHRNTIVIHLLQCALKRYSLQSAIETTKTTFMYKLI